MEKKKLALESLIKAMKSSDAESNNELRVKKAMTVPAPDSSEEDPAIKVEYCSACGSKKG